MATWMVVEDEPDIYDVLLAMFELWGIEGVAFVDGGEAIAWIDSVDRGEVVGDLPELAILDIRLPEVSGPEIGARLRLSERLRANAIVLVTAYRLSPEDEAAARAKADADMLLYKPLPPMPEFRKMLDQIIDKRKQIAAGQKAAAKPAEQPPAAVPAVTAKPPVTAPTSAPAAPAKPARDADSKESKPAKQLNEPAPKPADTKPSPAAATSAPTSKPTPPAPPASGSSTPKPTTGMLKPGHVPAVPNSKTAPETKSAPPAAKQPQSTPEKPPKPTP